MNRYTFNVCLYQSLKRQSQIFGLGFRMCNLLIRQGRLFSVFSGCWLLVAGCWLLTPASALLCECCLSVDPLG